MWSAAAPLSPRPPVGRSALPLTATVLWLVCAVAAVVAPFLKFNGYVSSSDGHVNAAVNASGWGTYSRVDGATQIGNDTRFGIVLVLAAVILIAAGVGAMVRARATWPTVCGLIGSAVLVTCALLIALDCMSRATFQTSDQANSFQTTTGVGLWLALGSGLVALGALVVGALELRNRRPAR